jgi:hypothetical protein
LQSYPLPFDTLYTDIKREALLGFPLCFSPGTDLAA